VLPALLAWIVRAGVSNCPLH